MMRFWLKIGLYLIALSWFSHASAGAYEDFFRAVAADNAEEVAQLLARGFDPNARDERGQPAITVGLRDGSPKVVEVLLSHPQLEPDALNAAGETPLMMAALRGNLTAMRRLAERGAAIQREGWAPLHYAASGPSDEAVAWLLAQGAPIDARAPNGNTALMMAARYGSEASVARLLDRGADASLRNLRHLDAAELARLSGRERLAETLARRAR